jgi:hypothetical protein
MLQSRRGFLVGAGADPKDRPMAFALSPITGARDADHLIAAVTRAVTTGRVTPAKRPKSPGNRDLREGVSDR